jgi:serine/threonine protein phosphatase PrpC
VPRVAGVCDRGVVHARNEDAMAIAALDHESFAALVVCDGVTTAPESDRASLAAARAACAAIVSGGAAPPGSSAATRVAHYSAVLSAATDDAHAAAVAVARTLGDPPEPPSCTYLGLVDAGDLAVVSWCGDSRAYWVADDGTALQLMTDHSLGAEAVAAGKTREEAESDPAFHTITRWLGADSVDHTPEVVSHALSGAGWLVACSDGLWNYASGPEQMASLVVGLAAQHGDPLALARAMVRWANEQGGHDNITVVVSRHDATPVATV